MLAVDTNVVVRYLVIDDDPQRARATEIVENGPIFVSVSVILECEWVLRSVYGFTRSQIVGAFRGLFGAPGVEVGDAVSVERAMRLADGGLDLADALHLAQAGHCEAFVTFDKALARRAGARGGIAVRLA